MAWTRNIAHGFAGSLNRIQTGQDRHKLDLSLRNGVFADRLDTLEARTNITARLQGHAKRSWRAWIARSKRFRRPSVFLNQCNFRSKWEA